MTLPASGAISLSQIQTEFGGSAPISISEYYSKATGIPTSGPISFSHFYGKANAFVWNYAIPNATVNFNLYATARANGWDGVRPLIATVSLASGYYMGASSRDYHGFDTGSGFPAGTQLTLINSGYIVGSGGSAPGGAGGHALVVRYPITVYNYNVIGGGGVGGANAYGYNYASGGAYSTAGGGGGAGYAAGAGAANTTGGYQYIEARNIVASSYGTYYGGGSPGSFDEYETSCSDALIGTVVGGAGGGLGSSGYAVIGNQYITWGATTTILGTIANI